MRLMRRVAVLGEPAAGSSLEPHPRGDLAQTDLRAGLERRVRFGGGARPERLDKSVELPYADRFGFVHNGFDRFRLGGRQRV